MYIYIYIYMCIERDIHINSYNVVLRYITVQYSIVQYDT